jgi:hypothetical protein
MRTSYTAKQFAMFLRKRCAEFDEDWTFIPRAGVTEVTDKYRLKELEEQVAKGHWYFFEVKEGRSECGVYVGPGRNVIAACNPFNSNPIFERRLQDCLDGR